MLDRTKSVAFAEPAQAPPTDPLTEALAQLRDAETKFEAADEALRAFIQQHMTIAWGGPCFVSDRIDARLELERRLFELKVEHDRAGRARSEALKRWAEVKK